MEAGVLMNEQAIEARLFEVWPQLQQTDAWDVHAALAAFGELSGYMWQDIGPKLTCDECAVIVELLLAIGARDDAYVLAGSHAQEDDEGDSHFMNNVYNQTGETQ
jgi:hypothetical protein